MPRRPTNQELCQRFRALLTGGATDAFARAADTIDGEMILRDPEDGEQGLLALTKPWRSDLWKAFAEIEERLCPTPARVRDAIARGEITL